MPFKNFEEFRKLYTPRELGVSEFDLQNRIYPYIKARSKNVVKCPKGSCMWCENSQEQVAPILVRFCPSCAKRVYERNTVERENLQIKEVQDFNGKCFYCRKKTYNLIEMNIRLCTKCLKRNAKRQMELDEERTNKIKKISTALQNTP